MEFATEIVSIDTLEAHPRNYRSHPEEQIAHLKASLADYGIVKNIVIANDNVILAGHGMVTAAREAGYTELPVYRIPIPSTDPKAQKFMVIDNEVSRQAEDDNAQLLALLVDIAKTEDLLGTGYDHEELDSLLAKLVTGGGEDGGPGPVPNVARTVPGDVWICGDHRIMCGDCGLETDWVKLCGPNKAQLIFTDPPYGIAYVEQSLVADGYDPVTADADKNIGDRYHEWAVMWYAFSTDNATAYAFNSPSKPETRYGLEAAGWDIKDTIVWIKPNFSPGRNDYQNKWESILYARKGVGHYWCGRRDLTNVWEFSRDGGVDHPTNKPVALTEHAITASSKPGDIVADPFIGSGTTLIAAEQTQRVCYGMEIEPKYCDVTVARWCNLTGKPAVLEATGEDFNV